MDIRRGFQFDEPNYFISWGIDENTLASLFKDTELNCITTGYFTTTCKSLNGLNCRVGFHFEPRENGHLLELEFFRTNYDDLQKSFDEFQYYFEKKFGQPTYFRAGTEGFNDYLWVFDNVSINHVISNRYGPEEHMRIISSSPSVPY